MHNKCYDLQLLIQKLENFRKDKSTEYTFEQDSFEAALKMTIEFNKIYKNIYKLNDLAKSLLVVMENIKTKDVKEESQFKVDSERIKSLDKAIRGLKGYLNNKDYC